MKKDIETVTVGVPIGKIVFYRTTKRVDNNPEGDARRRASWRSPLEKPTIPAGFLYGIDENGTIFDHSEIKHAVKNDELLRMLKSASSPPLDVDIEEEETVASVLAEIPGGITQVVETILREMDMTPKELRDLLAHNKRAAVASTEKEKEIDVVAEL